MRVIKASTSAYPSTDEVTGQKTPGLTIREHFASMILQGILSSSEVLKRFQDKDYMEFSVRWADKLIDELNRTYTEEQKE